MAFDQSKFNAEELRDTCRAWLADNLPQGWMAAIDAGDTERVSALRRSLDTREFLVRLGSAGYATPTWPAEYGAGLSLDPGQARPVNEMLRHYEVPRPHNIIGIGMGGPTVLTWGSEELKARLIRPCATDEEIWCQLFSEPGAGSDVAGLATRAVKDGDEWVINGQKVWTSLAHQAKWGLLVARTDVNVPKHRGLTYFVIDMDQPGVVVRPLTQITGDAEFNEVFLEDARVPDSMRLGAEGDGWRVTLTTLMNERVSLSGAGSVGGDAVGGSPVDELIARHAPCNDPHARDRLAQAYIEGRIVKMTNDRAAAQRRSGGEAGPEGSVTKLLQAELNKRLQKLAVDLEGPGGVAWDGPGLKLEESRGVIGGGGHEPVDVARGFLRAQANTIEGGTSNIMRNILGERVLGLPKEPDPSKDPAWKDVPRSA